MQLFIDDADLSAIERLLAYFPCDGVTTNPSILKKAGREPFSLLEKIRELLPRESLLHVQVVSQKAEDMLSEALYIRDRLGLNTYIKVPAVSEGLKAIALMQGAGIPVTATAVYTPMQAFLAAKAGAKYAAPYVNRLDNMGADGVQVAKTIHDMFSKHRLDCRVLAASFKNTQQILELCAYGIGAVTVAPDVMDTLVKHPAADNAVSDFVRDFESLAGKGKTMLDA